MYKIKRFIDCNIPVTTCNFRCSYCYITQQRLFDNHLPTFEHTPEEIAQALSYDRLGGTCILNLCGDGETLLPPEVPAIIKALLNEGHFIMVVTNGSITPRFKEISEFPKELRDRLFIKFSFHYMELVNKNLLKTFFDNIKLMADCGVSYTVELTPYDELTPYIDEIKKVSLENIGTLPHVTVGRSHLLEGLPILTNLSKSEYAKVWGVFDSELFDFKLTTFNVKRKEFCYAGDWILSLNNIDSGNLKQCYMNEIFYNIYDNPKEPIPFEAIGCNCREEHCYNSHVFLTLGAIPSLDTPYFVNLRNREVDGKEWLSTCVKEIFSSKLAESNKEYSPIKKLKCTLKHSDNPFIQNAMNNLRNTKQRLQ